MPAPALPVDPIRADDQKKKKKEEEKPEVEEGKPTENGSAKPEVGKEEELVSINSSSKSS